MYGRKTLGNLLPGPVDICTVLEIERDVGDSVFRGRTQNGLARNTEKLHFERRDYAALDLFRRHTRRLQDHFDLNRRYVRKGVDRDGTERIAADSGDQPRQKKHEDPLCQREVDQAPQHGSFTLQEGFELRQTTRGYLLIGRKGARHRGRRPRLSLENHGCQGETIRASREDDMGVVDPGNG